MQQRQLTTAEKNQYRGNVEFLMENLVFNYGTMESKNVIIDIGGNLKIAALEIQGVDQELIDEIKFSSEDALIGLMSSFEEFKTPLGKYNDHGVNELQITFMQYIQYVLNEDRRINRDKWIKIGYSFD
jgi:hypothetical protein